MSISITKTGLLTHPITDYTYMVENFSETNRINTSEWTIGGSSTISNGVITMTGVNPAVNSKVFTLNPDDIIVCEFTVALPTPSTATSSPGLYLGPTYGTSWYGWRWDGTKWVLYTTGSTNTYFLSTYNIESSITMKNYFIGSNVDIDKVPNGYSTDISSNNRQAKCYKAPSGTTTARLRSGYNTNTSMVITLKDFKIYKLTDYGFGEIDGSNGAIGKGFVHSNNFYEY